MASDLPGEMREREDRIKDGKIMGGGEIGSEHSSPNFMRFGEIVQNYPATRVSGPDLIRCYAYKNYFGLCMPASNQV